MFYVEGTSERPQNTLFIQFQRSTRSCYHWTTEHFVHSIPALCSFNSSTLFIQFQHFVHSVPELCSFNFSTLFIEFQHFVRSVPALSSLSSSTLFIEFQHFLHWIPALCSFNSSTSFIQFHPLFIQFQHFVHWIPALCSFHSSLRHLPAVGDLPERRAGGGQHVLLRGALQGAVRPPAGGLAVPRPALRCLLPSHGGPQVAATPLLRPQGPRDAAPLPPSGASGERHEGQWVHKGLNPSGVHVSRFGLAVRR